MRTTSVNLQAHISQRKIAPNIFVIRNSDIKPKRKYINHWLNTTDVSFYNAHLFLIRFLVVALSVLRVLNSSKIKRCSIPIVAQNQNPNRRQIPQSKQYQFYLRIYILGWISDFLLQHMLCQYILLIKCKINIIQKKNILLILNLKKNHICQGLKRQETIRM